MSNSKEVAMLNRELAGQAISWQGDCAFVVPSARTRFDALVAVTPKGLNCFQKRAFKVDYELMPAGKISEVGAGVTIKTDRGDLPGVLFKFDGTGMVLVPKETAQGAVDELMGAMQAISTG